jgi:hypothetical protein
MGRIAIIVIVAAALCGCASTPNKEPAPGATIERPPPRRPVAPPPAKEKPLPRELSQEEIHLAITKHNPEVTACLKRHEDPGFYMMKLQILSDGSVSKVAPVRVPTRKEDPRPYADLPPDVDGGKDPHSPTSACLVRLLRSIKFPRFKGWPMDVQYPLILRHN